MPKLDGILETAIHTEDMARSRAFYEGVLGLEPIATTGCLPMRWPAATSSWSFARAPRNSPWLCLAAPSPAMVVMARYMWLLPSARMNLIVGRRTSLHAASPSKGVMIGRAVAAAFISATQTGTFWNSQRRDCGRCIRYYKLISRVRH